MFGWCQLSSREVRMLLQRVLPAGSLRRTLCGTAHQQLRGQGDQRTGEQPRHRVADAREVPPHRCAADRV